MSQKVSPKVNFTALYWTATTVDMLWSHDKWRPHHSCAHALMWCGITCAFSQDFGVFVFNENSNSWNRTLNFTLCFGPDFEIGLIDFFLWIFSLEALSMDWWQQGHPYHMRWYLTWLSKCSRITGDTLQCMHWPHLIWCAGDLSINEYGNYFRHELN